MRAVLAIVLLGACASAGTGSSGSTRPGVMPMLSELPGDPVKRDAVLDSSQAVAGPEQRKGMTGKERKAETAASTAAAILGGMFSKTQNTTLGTAGSFDEGNLAPVPVAPAPISIDAPAPAAPPPPTTELLPWIKLQ